MHVVHLMGRHQRDKNGVASSLLDPGNSDALLLDISPLLLRHEKIIVKQRAVVFLQPTLHLVKVVRMDEPPDRKYAIIRSANANIASPTT